MYLCDHENNNVCTQQVFEPNTNNHRFLSPTDDNVFPQPFLPSELIVEILLRLPVRSLLQFRLVCKLWKTLFSDPKFAKKHLLISIADPSMTHQRLVFHDCSYPLKSLFENPSVPVIPDMFNGLELEINYHYILGSCNGFLCLFDPYQCNIIMYNPSIGLKSKSSPKIHHWANWSMPYIGFGYDQVNDKYKVLIVECMDLNFDYEVFHESLTKIYTFGEDSWRTIQDLPTPLNQDLGKYVSGTLNWVHHKGYKQYVILSFNLEKEDYQEVLLPQNVGQVLLPQNDGSLCVLNDCLCFCFVDKTHFVVWLMKEYGVIESWTKLMNIPCEKLIFKYSINNFSNIELLFISENGVVLLMVSYQLFLYNLNSGVLDHPFISINNVSDPDPVIYRETLISPRRVVGSTEPM